MGSGFEENVTEVREQITEVRENITEVQVQSGNEQILFGAVLKVSADDEYFICRVQAGQAAGLCQGRQEVVLVCRQVDRCTHATLGDCAAPCCSSSTATTLFPNHQNSILSGTLKSDDNPVLSLRENLLFDSISMANGVRSLRERQASDLNWRHKWQCERSVFTDRHWESK